MTADEASDEAGNEAIDSSRRKFLTAAMVGMGAVGAAFVATPFISSWSPSERALALGAPTEFDVSKVEPGQMVITTWRRKPIFIVNRTPQMLATLSQHDDRLKDPRSTESAQPPYADNTVRARRAQYLVVIGICTHLGCLPKPRFQPGDLSPDWPGGWLCPCHGSRYDLAGRVFDGSPAPLNLAVPPYAFRDARTVVIGVDDAKQQGVA